jgi:hypothetical protein
MKVIVSELSLRTSAMNLLSRNLQSIRSVGSRGLVDHAIVSLRLKELSGLQCMAQAFVVHHGSLIDHSNSVISGVGE